MMFWKFQTQRPDAPMQVPGPAFIPATEAAPMPHQQTPYQAQPVVAQPVAPQPVAPQAVPPEPAPRAVAEQPSAPQEVALEPEAPGGYEQAAERTMRFLAESLDISPWVLFKHQSGMLDVVAGYGAYQQYLPDSELPVGRLAEIPTVNLLNASPPQATTTGADRRQGGIDPATVAPFGVPLVDAGGNLFGVLCALGARDAALRAGQARPVLDYAASMLGAVVRSELTLEEATRRTERAQADALVDPLTGLHNRRAWDQLLATEDQRCSRHGYDAVVFVIDLDGLKATNDRFGHEAGDELIKNAANTLERCVRRTDVVARVGGDEFSILAVKCDANAAARIREHIESTLLRASAPATVGCAVRSEAGDLFEAWRQADGAMYHRKRGNPRSGVRTADEAPSEQNVSVEPSLEEPISNEPAAEQPASNEPVAEQPVSQEPAFQLPTFHEPEQEQPPFQDMLKPLEPTVVTQILERVLPALVNRVQSPPPAAPEPPPAPVFAAPESPAGTTRPLIVPDEAEVPATPEEPEPQAEATPEPQATAAPEPPAAAMPEPQAPPAPEPPPAPQPRASSEPSEDLVDIVSRLSRLSESDRRLLDVFFKGSR